uniref:Vitellogenin receptor n=1 Tax=Laticauda laticaudata TaxID=8630 RepID=A0A8C5WPP3_LATLA
NPTPPKIRKVKHYYLLAVQIKCNDLHFQCKSGQCISYFLHCDGNYNCKDHSDEEDCPVPKQCGNTCINYTLVCNGKSDCQDGMDEGSYCAMPCQKPCAHICYKSPRGPQCACNEGFNLRSDGHSCKDINECKELTVDKCSQACVNTEGSYHCTCHPGYLLEPDDHICKVIGKILPCLFLWPCLIKAPDEHLLAVHLIRGFHTFSLDYSVSVKVSSLVLAIKDAGRASLKRILPVEGTVISLALDWLSANIYWIDNKYTSVQVAASEGKYRHMVLSDGLYNPTTVVVHPPTASMCIVDLGGEHGIPDPTIECAAMDGSRRRILWKRSLVPVGLTIVDAGTWLYWADQGKHIRLDGSGHRIIRRGIHGLKLFTVGDGMMFWTTAVHNCKQA